MSANTDTEESQSWETALIRLDEDILLLICTVLCHREDHNIGSDNTESTDAYCTYSKHAE